jgi:hypothetical protein
MKAKAIYDVVLVSAFGRLDPLATELAQRGMEVGLLDLTSGFSNLEWRDINGPFPMVTPSPALPSHLDWLVARGSSELDRGFALWMRQGPLELRGSLGPFYSEKNVEVGLLKEYLAKRLQSSSPGRVFGKFYRDHSFQENWLIHLSHGLTQNQMTLHCQSAFGGSPFPLHQSAQLLKLNKESLEELRAAAVNAGVDHFDVKDIQDVVMQEKKLDAIQLESVSLRAHFFVWGLNQEEFYFLNPEMFSKLFKTKEPVLSDWVWRRLELTTAQELFKAMPDSFLMLQNPEWAWTEENFVLFKRESEKEWDLWLRTPRRQFDGPDLARKITEELTARLGVFEGEVRPLKNPEVFSFSVYENQKVNALPEIRIKNVLFEGREWDQRLDLASRFEKQVALLSDLENRKQKLEKKLQKAGGVIDQTIHAP